MECSNCRKPICKQLAEQILFVCNACTTALEM
nr:unnamed protein product [Callosobruchus chinensis]